MEVDLLDLTPVNLAFKSKTKLRELELKLALTDNAGLRMANVLITGITGMVGSHLADYVINQTDWNVFGWCVGVALGQYQPFDTAHK